ncbi:MAG: hypothetical protein M3Y86_09490 [Verrucomicrobiota bacterium]|nr:hypothetical protein [Verrucomicrobiota bacterium]
MNVLQSAEYTPVFNWSPPRSRKISLVSFLVASAVLHALCFYIFQIIYPPTVALLPPPARVSLISADTEDGRVLLRWIEAEDPALSSTTQRPPDAATLTPPDPVHVPSYAGRLAPLRELPASEPDLRVPSAIPPAPVPRAHPSATPQKISVATTIHFRDEQTLGAPELPPQNFSASRSEPPQAAEFRIAIDARGAVRYCFLENSSDDPALDAQAARFLSLCRFPAAANQTTAAANALTWTSATFAWGNDFPIPARAAMEKPAP